MSELTKEQKQDLVQKEARKRWHAGNCWGLLAMATGTGKSKCAVDEVIELKRSLGQADPRVLLVVPTEKLRDDNWREEFDKWGAHAEYKYLQRSCYASITRFERQYYDLVIFDECHNLTELNSTFFEKNTVMKVLALSATPPDPKGNQTDKDKVLLFKQLRLKTDFYYPLDQARKDGIVSDMEIWVVETTLDNTKKYIEAGRVGAKFMQTEQQQYEYLSRVIKQMAISGNAAIKFKTLERMRVIHNSIAKHDVIDRLIKRVSDNNRVLVFGGSIPAITKLLDDKVYHSKSGKVGHQMLDDFKAGKIDILGVVEALNEGHNIANLDIGIIGQLSSNARDLVQRIGRIIRYRPGHIARIFIIVATGTQDEKWFEKAIEGFDKSIIKYVHAKNI